MEDKYLGVDPYLVAEREIEERKLLRSVKDLTVFKENRRYIAIPRRNKKILFRKTK